jgi:hypothetical protein
MENTMPTLTELQRRQSLLPRPQQVMTMQVGEEIVADTRAMLTPSQLVERKLAARNYSDLRSSTPSVIRPRAK